MPKKDFDLEVGFWIKDVPYLWVPSKTLPECKRFYFISGIDVFSESTHEHALSKISDRIVKEEFKFEDLEYSILPIKGNCSIVFNYFLVWTPDTAHGVSNGTLAELFEVYDFAAEKMVFPKTKYEIRKNGVRFDDAFAHTEYSSFEDGYISIIGTHNHLVKRIPLYIENFKDTSVKTKGITHLRKTISDSEMKKRHTYKYQMHHAHLNVSKVEKLYPTSNLVAIHTTHKGKFSGLGDIECYHEEQGRRSSMEDTMFAAQLGENVWFYGVLDGHGGDKASKHFARIVPSRVYGNLTKQDVRLYQYTHVKRIVQNTFLEVDREWCESGKDTSGTTFTGCIVTPVRVITINLGDSRTILRGISGEHSTEDHKPDLPRETKRIEAAGGWFTTFGGMSRVQGNLAVSRALGDCFLKKSLYDGGAAYAGEKSYVSPIPELRMYRRKDISEIVIACDGLFDVFTNEDVWYAYDDYYDDSEVPHVFNFCEKIVGDSLYRGTTDNVSVMLLKLEK